jgi:hypothetical protein
MSRGQTEPSSRGQFKLTDPFAEAIDRLMARALVPGGTILVLGGRGPDYQEIYRQLDAKATAARLKILEGFDQPLRAGHRPAELAAIGTLTGACGTGWKGWPVTSARYRPS